MTVVELLGQLRATRTSLDATIAALEATIVTDMGAPAEPGPPAREEAPVTRAELLARARKEPGACPHCGAPRSRREESGGYGGSAKTVHCGACARAIE